MEAPHKIPHRQESLAGARISGGPHPARHIGSRLLNRTRSAERLPGASRHRFTRPRIAVRTMGGFCAHGDFDQVVLRLASMTQLDLATIALGRRIGNAEVVAWIGVL